MEMTNAERMERIKEDMEAFCGKEVDLPFRDWPSLDDYLDSMNMDSIPDPYYDKRGRSWYLSADKLKYNRKHKGKGKGRKRRKR